MGRAVFFSILLSLLAASSAQIAPNQVAGNIEFKQGRPLHLLPGAKDLNPRRAVRSINIRLTAARIVGPTNAAAKLIDYVGPVYRNDNTGALNVFGPTLRLKGGEILKVKMINNLTDVEDAAVELNSFHHPLTTNLHAHGLHSPPGVAAQAEAGEYKGGDNIFFTVKPKALPTEEPKKMVYTFRLPPDHMPGLYWLHPHAHGSTTIQVPTANSLIIVAGDTERWLPDSSGCKAEREALAAAPEIILHLALLTFKAPNRSTRTSGPVRKLLQGHRGGGGGGGGGAVPVWKQQWAIDRDDPNIQIFSQLTTPQNPLLQPPHTLAGTGTNSDFVLLNGGWQPVISMKSDTYYRWRVAWATTKRFAILYIVDPATGQPTPNCELLLHAKDGVYLQQIPRPGWDMGYSTSGTRLVLSGPFFGKWAISPQLPVLNRAELLVKCSGVPNTSYILRAGGAFNPYGATCNFNTPNNFEQATIATIKMARGPDQPQTAPPPEACKPRRPGYAADLRDAALAAARATAKLLPQPVTFAMGQAFGCLVNGANFSFPDPDPIDLPLGTVVEWDMKHAGVHPLHTHTNPFQLISMPTQLMAGCTSTNWIQVGDYQDVLTMPFAAQAATVRLRLQPGEYTGYTVMHCHTLAHEDMGCMKVMKFSCPGYPDPQPKECPGFSFPVPSTYV